MNKQETYDALEKVIEVLSKFDRKPLVANRKDLASAVESLTNGVLKIKFYRKGIKGKDNEKTIKLWFHKVDMDNNMHPDIEISVREGNIQVFYDILFKTMYGIKEQMEEETAFESKWSRRGY